MAPVMAPVMPGRLFGPSRWLYTAFSFMPSDAHRPFRYFWRSVAHRLDEERAKNFPRALADVLTTLPVLTDRQRFSLGIRVAVRMDLTEAVRSLLYLAHSQGSTEALVAAAALASSPTADPTARSSVGDAAADVDLSHWQQRLLEVYLSPELRGDDGSLTELRVERWPGYAEQPLREYNAGPLVYIQEEVNLTNSAARLLWLLAGELVAAGAVVRRISADVSRPMHPGHINDQVLVLCWDERSVRPELADLPVIALPDSWQGAAAVEDTLSAIDHQLRELDQFGLNLTHSPVLRDRTPARPDPVALGVRMRAAAIRRDLQSAIFDAILESFAAGGPRRYQPKSFNEIVDEFQTMESARGDVAFDYLRFRELLAAGEWRAAIEDAVSAALTSLVDGGHLRFDERAREYIAA